MSQPDSEKASDIFKSIQTEKCDILNFVQTSLNWHLIDTRNQLHSKIRTSIPIYKLIPSRNKFRSPNRVIPGGTAQVICGDWTSRVVEQIHDFRSL